MSHRQGGHKTKTLAFPTNWTTKWLYDAITATPKWQTKSILNAGKYNQWIAFESSALNGLTLPERDNPELNFVRSIAVGIKVSQAGEQYERIMNKTTLEDKVQTLNQILATPIVGDMVRSMTESMIQIPEVEPSEEEVSIMPSKRPMVEVLPNRATTKIEVGRKAPRRQELLVSA